MLVHMEIPGVSLNLQDPLLRLTGIHPRQTGGPLLDRFLLTAQEGASGQFYPGSRTGRISVMSGRSYHFLGINSTFGE